MSEQGTGHRILSQSILEVFPDVLQVVRVDQIKPEVLLLCREAGKLLDMSLQDREISAHRIYGGI